MSSDDVSGMTIPISDVENYGTNSMASTFGVPDGSAIKQDEYVPELSSGEYEDYEEGYDEGEGIFEKVEGEKVEFSDVVSNVHEEERLSANKEIINQLQKVNYSEEAAIAVDNIRSTIGVSPDEYRVTTTTAEEMIEQAVQFFPRQWRTEELVSESPIFRISIGEEKFEFTTLSFDKRSEHEEPIQFFERGKYRRMFCPIPVNIAFITGLTARTFILNSEWPSGVLPPHGRMLMPRISGRLNDEVEEFILQDVLLTNNFVRQICQSRGVKYLAFHRCFALESIIIDKLPAVRVVYCDIIMIHPGNSLTINLRSNLSRLDDLTVFANHIIRSETPETVYRCGLKQVKIPGLETRQLHRFELHFDGDDWPIVLGLPDNMRANPITNGRGEDMSRYEPVSRGFIEPAPDSNANIAVMKLYASLPARLNPKLPWLSSRDVMMCRITPNTVKNATHECLRKMNYDLGKSDEIFVQSLMRKLKYDSSILLPHVALANLQTIIAKRKTQVLSLNTGSAVGLQIVPYCGTLESRHGGNVPDICADPKGYMMIEEMLFSDNKNLTAILLDIESEADLRHIGFEAEKNGNLYTFPNYDVMAEKTDDSVPVPYDVNCRKKAFNIELRDFFDWQDHERRVNYSFTFGFITKTLVTVPASGQRIVDQRKLKAVVDDFHNNFQKFMNPAMEGTCGKITTCVLQ